METITSFTSELHMGYQINMLTVGDINAASSRLRCFFLGESLKAMGVDVSYNTFDENEDLLIVQKNISTRIFEYAQSVKKKGGYVLYDIDDEGEGMAWLRIDPHLRSRFLSICDILTVNTQHRFSLLDRDPDLNRIPCKFVRPDPIDYLPWAPIGGSFNMKGLPPKGCWFGNSINLSVALPYIDVLLEANVLHSFDAITSGAVLEKLFLSYPRIGYKKWDLQRFATTLKHYDFCVLIHDDTAEGNKKSNNKMMAALALGVVPLVSQTVAYAETAHAIGIPELIVSNPKELAAKIVQPGFLETMNHKIRLPECQSYLKEFSSEKIADQFAQQLLKFTTAQAETAH